MKVLKYSKKYQDHIHCTFAYKLACVDDKFSKPIVIFRSENAAFQFIEAILKEYEQQKKSNKNLIMTEEGEKQFHSSNTCWICEKLIDDDDKKVRAHCHISQKYRGSAHWSCNVNLQLTKKSSCNISQF